MKARALFAFAAFASLAAGCGGDKPRTVLDITATDTWAGRAEFRLECDPVGGDVPRPAHACDEIARNPRLLTAPFRFACSGGWRLTIRGRLDGEPLRVERHTCLAPEEPLGVLGVDARTLAKHIVPNTQIAYLGASPSLRRSDLADELDVPANTPGDLLRIAHLQARALHDEKPDRLRVKLGAQYVIELYGDFVCDRSCSYPAGADAPRGTHASIVVDPQTFEVVSFSLGG